MSVPQVHYDAVVVQLERQKRRLTFLHSAIRDLVCESYDCHTKDITCQVCELKALLSEFEFGDES